MIYIISGLIGACGSAAILVFYFWSNKKALQETQSSVQKILRKSREDIDRERREAIIKLKDELYKKRSESDLDLRKSKIELQRLEHKYQKREDLLEQREVMLDSLRTELQGKERDFSRRLDQLSSGEIKLKRVYEEFMSKLEMLSGMKKDEAKKYLVDSLREEVKVEQQKWIVKATEETRLVAKEKSIKILCTAMQRYLPEQVTLHSSSIIHLPNEEMKGRIIGKEGRNIKALEMATGMEFVIGEIPEIITISGFNPIRREIAKRTLNKLINDGRINPTRIEETVENCEKELDHSIEEIGHQTLMEFGFSQLHPELNILLGKLHFRTSFTQNNLEHSKEVAYFARMIAEEFGLDGKLASRCGLSHDIGKAISAEVEGPHALIGADFAKKYGEDPIVVNAIAAHHEEVPSKTIYGFITHLADAISASRPGARKETLSTYIKRLEQLEDLSHNFDGVKKAYALQAGREIRVIVDEDRLDDDRATLLARDIANKIESEMNFPGQIKVNVIREKRIIEYAK
ncbi:ribonuclease Y [Candidatus Babeliales bacterium]|nr:ribonuclease Y [Candidatus Babeliales bacterium]